MIRGDPGRCTAARCTRRAHATQTVLCARSFYASGMDYAGFDATVDHLKFVAATLDQVQGELSSEAVSRTHAIASAVVRLSYLQQVMRELVESFCPHCAQNMGHYADYRPIASRLPLGD